MSYDMSHSTKEPHIKKNSCGTATVVVGHKDTYFDTEIVTPLLPEMITSHHFH